jgi:hypothetical protein
MARRHGGALDFARVFSSSRSEFADVVRSTVPWVNPSGMLGVCWPKRSSGAPTDLEERSVRTIGLGTGLVDGKVCPVTPVWSALKFVWRRSDRPRTRAPRTRRVGGP